jgi:tetratricopeptide (TPR) repeat protein
LKIKAIQFLERNKISANNGDAQTKCDRGTLYYKQGKNDAAFIEYNQALAINPNFVKAYLNRGIIYYTLYLLLIDELLPNPYLASIQFFPAWISTTKGTLRLTAFSIVVLILVSISGNSSGGISKTNSSCTCNNNLV